MASCVRGYLFASKEKAEVVCDVLHGISIHTYPQPNPNEDEKSK
jgi:hypothetical protein